MKTKSGRMRAHVYSAVSHDVCTKREDATRWLAVVGIIMQR